MHDELFNPTHLKSLCEQYGVVPSKQYGQHFLISQKPIEKMVEAAELNQTDTVIEVGPGFGVLTFALATLVKKVIAFEIEKKLQPYWEEKQKEFPNVKIVWGNVLHSFSPYQGESEGVISKSSDSLIPDPTPPSPGRGGGYKVVANLPYQITSHILRTFLEAEQKPEKIVVMVQKEVAQRIVAGKGDMNLLALSVQYYGEPRIVCDVPRGMFWPVPEVDSAVVAIDMKTLKHENIKTDDSEFFRIARAGFSHPRKQVWRNIAEGLKLEGKKVKKALQEIVGDEKARAEDLSVEEWKQLVLSLRGTNGSE